MRFLADESCDFAVVRVLRTSGHDVLAVTGVSPGADDEAIGQCAVKEQRILLTEDKDFGQLVYAKGQETRGVILLRFPAKTRAQIGRVLMELVNSRGEELVGKFVVVQPGLVVKSLEKGQGRLSIGIKFSFERASQGYLQQKQETALFEYVLAPEGLKMRVTTQTTSHFGDKDLIVGDDPNSAVVEGLLQKLH